LDEEIKKSVRKVVKEAEAGVARTLLRWRFRREGKVLPFTDQELREESLQIADRAHKALSGAGKSLLQGIKRAYRAPGKGEDDPT